MSIKLHRFSAIHYQLPKILSEQERKSDWRYNLMDLDESGLHAELKQMSRETLIEWLEWNDPNGVYSDEDSDNEGMKRLTKNDAEQIIIDKLLRD